MQYRRRLFRIHHPRNNAKYHFTEIIGLFLREAILLIYACKKMLSGHLARILIVAVPLAAIEHTFNNPKYKLGQKWNNDETALCLLDGKIWSDRNKCYLHMHKLLLALI